MAMRIGVALSGGKDSSLTAALLKRQGHEVIAFHLLLGPPALAPVREIARRLGIELRMIDLASRFEAEIIAPFIREYERGRTPNPCVCCNPLFKFGFLLEEARAAGCEKLASGHYARVEKGRERFLLKKNLDPGRDESYFLCRLRPEQLPPLLLPLGEIPLKDVRQLMEYLLAGIPVLPSSAEACFLGGKKLNDFLREHYAHPPRPGEIVDREGKILGEHPGYQFYTVGQRRGLSSASGKRGPLFVLRVIPAENRVVVGEKSNLFSSKLLAAGANWVSIAAPLEEIRVMAKIRYTHPGAEATMRPEDSGAVEVEFDCPQEAVTPGQAVVFYDGDLLLGGAWIIGPI